MRREWGDEHWQGLHEGAIKTYLNGTANEVQSAPAQSPLTRMLQELQKKKPETFNRIVGQVVAHLGKSMEDFENELKAASAGKSRKSA